MSHPSLHTAAQTIVEYLAALEEVRHAPYKDTITVSHDGHTIPNRVMVPLTMLRDLALALEHTPKIPIGLNDRHGNPIHLGDWLRFDKNEWYRGSARLEHDRPDLIFQIKIEGGQIQMFGTPSDMDSWCEIIDPPQSAPAVETPTLSERVLSFLRILKPA